MKGRRNGSVDSSGEMGIVKVRVGNDKSTVQPLSVEAYCVEISFSAPTSMIPALDG
jgi:hypothetical protein